MIDNENMQYNNVNLSDIVVSCDSYFNELALKNNRYTQELFLRVVDNRFSGINERP